jgi:transposase-like protein
MAKGQTNPKGEGVLSNPFPSEARIVRGHEIAKSNVIVENEDGSFSVPSQSQTDVVYQVKVLGEVWVCSCPDFENRADAIEACKHVFAVKFWIASRVELREEPKPKVFADDAIQCPCGSIRVVKYGHANAKQVFKCRDCGRKFREGLIKKAQYSPETITLTLDLYFSGLSLRKITRTLNDHFDMSLGKSTVYRWIENFVPRISEYVSTLAPQLSQTWQADEVFVKMKGGEGIKNMENMAYLWNVMDRKTRFLLASKLSKHRDDDGAIKAMLEAKKNAHESQPEAIITDAHRSYNEGISYAWFNDKRPKHIARAGLRKHDATNNRIERLNGTLRERVKVQRGWKTMKTPLAEGQRIQYNFVKPHMALEGQTPAEVAGVGVNGKNKWLAMLTEAITRDETGGRIRK